MVGQCHTLLSTGESTHELDCNKGKDKDEDCPTDEAENDDCAGTVLCRRAALPIDPALESIGMKPSSFPTKVKASLPVTVQNLP